MKFLCSQTAVLALVTLSCADPVQSQSNGPGFVLSVRIHRYLNPTHRLGMSRGNRCCDSRETSDCVDPCDNAFSFCLRPYGYPQQADIDDCPLGAYTVEAFCFSSDVEERDCDMLLFNSSDDSFGSAPNPLIFSGESWPGGFQLLTEVEDQDVNPDDFVDRIITEQWLSPESGNTIQMESPGEFNFGFLRMSFNVICNENFGGPNCTTNCGVEGCTLDPCSPSPCQNGGSCVSTGPPSQYSCQCVEGFEGDSCDEPLSDDSTDMLGSRGSNTAAIVGGVMGGVVLVLLVLVVAIIVLLVVCRRRQNEDQTYLKPDSVTGGGFEPGDNPNYTAATGTHAHYAESGLYHKLENPLYTAVENHEYATPDTHSPRGGSGVHSGHYSTVSKAAPPSHPPHHYEYVVNSSSNDSPTAVLRSSNNSELSNSSNHHEFNNTLYEQLLH